MRQSVFSRFGLGLSLLSLVGVSLFLGQLAQGQENELEEITSFASGARFYLDKGSFVPIGNGKLQYKVVGNGGPTNSGDTSQRISVNEIDCGTGRLQAPVNSWVEDKQGSVSSQFPGSTGPITVTNRTKLHGLLKDACNENLPDVQGNW